MKLVHEVQSWRTALFPFSLYTGKLIHVRKSRNVIGCHDKLYCCWWEWEGVRVQAPPLEMQQTSPMFWCGVVARTRGKRRALRGSHRIGRLMMTRVSSSPPTPRLLRTASASLTAEGNCGSAAATTTTEYSSWKSDHFVRGTFNKQADRLGSTAQSARKFREWPKKAARNNDEGTKTRRLKVTWKKGLSIAAGVLFITIGDNKWGVGKFPLRKILLMRRKKS